MRNLKVVKDESKKVIAGFLALLKKDVLVGIPEVKNSRKNESISNSQLGYIQDKGSPAANIPPRPWLEKGVESSQKETIRILKDTILNSFESKNSITKGLGKVGLIAQSSVKGYIKNKSNFTPLSKETVKQRKRKGFSGRKPLIETGQLLNSVNYVVRDK